MIQKQSLAALAALALVTLTSTAPVQAQAYPAKPIRLIVPFAVGGGADILGRLFAQKLYEQTGRTVVVDTRAGAIDADHLRPMVGEHHRRKRPRPDAGEFDDAQS